MAVTPSTKSDEQAGSSLSVRTRPSIVSSAASRTGTKNAAADDKIRTYSLLLSQAIKANDWNEIDNLLRTIWIDGGTTAKRVARRLSVVDVIPLLRIAGAVMREERLKNSPKHIQSTNNWVAFAAQLLRNHSAYLSMLEELDAELNDLLDYVRKRAHQMRKLMELDGKLAWMMETAEQRRNPIRYGDQQAAVLFEDSEGKPTEEVMYGVLLD